MNMGGGSGILGKSRGSQPASVHDESSSVWSGKTVLVVDDLAPVRDQLCAIYAAIGMKVVGTASNGVEALAFLEKNSVDLVSLDIIMPEMDGVECYRKIRAKNLSCRSVFVSWLAADPRVPEKLKEEIPVELFQGKPVDAVVMSERLKKVFSFEAGGVPVPRPEEERVAV